MVVVSIIIPCYNHGIYLDEAVQSVLEQTFADFEIIIVNDGSTDSYTNKLINSYSHEKIRIVTTDNQGLPSARNNGISASEGKYLLPLDADDRIGKYYLEKAVQVLEHNENIGIVYCEAELFGEEEGKLQLPDYSPDFILIFNMIFCSALFRKRLWHDIGGYNHNMKYGLEDWDLWLSIISLGYDVYKIPEVLFYYRMKRSSMINDLVKDKAKLLQMNIQIIINHQSLYLNNIENLYIFLNKTLSTVKGFAYLSSLYIDLGQGFQQDLAIIGITPVDRNNKFELSFDTSHYKGIKGIRFDPVERQICTLKLNQLTITKSDIDNVLSLNDIKGLIKHNGIMNAAGDIYFYTTNPQVYIPIKCDFESLSIEGELKPIESSQLIKEIEKKNQEIEKKNQEIEKKNQEIEKIRKSIFWKITAPLRFMIKTLKKDEYL